MRKLISVNDGKMLLEVYLCTMNFLELVNQRQSCRAYDPTRQVEREKLESCIEAARLAPSACNAQPWKFIVVDEPELKKSIISTWWEAIPVPVLVD